MAQTPENQSPRRPWLNRCMDGANFDARDAVDPDIIDRVVLWERHFPEKAFCERVASQTLPIGGPRRLSAYDPPAISADPLTQCIVESRLRLKPCGLSASEYRGIMGKNPYRLAPDR